MTQFFVNNTEVVLPSDFSFKFNEENTEVTKRGEYSFDIVLSLENSLNVRIFKHINRRNSLTLSKEADAYFIADNKRYVGRIVDIENTDKTVSFQFVAGNSEMNYESREKKIWEYNWGVETEFNTHNIMQSVQVPSYLNRFVCAPVKYSNTVTNTPSYTTIEHPSLIKVENATLSPYLYYYIIKMQEVFGYEISENVLSEDDLIKYMFLPARVRSTKYSDLLPDMTVSEFLTAIEEFFNVTFNFNSKNKTLRIVRNYTNLSEKKRISPSVKDSFRRELNSEEDIYNFKKLKYSISGSLSKFLKLPDDIIVHCEIREFSNLAALMAALVEDEKDKYIIYKTLDNNNEYIFGSASSVNYYRRIVTGLTGFLYPINLFADYVSDLNSEFEFELNLVPASIVPYEFDEFGHVGDFPSGTRKSFKFSTQVCSVDGDLDLSVDQGIVSAIDQGSDQVSRSDKIEVAFYRGLCKAMGFNGTDKENADFPIPFTCNRPFFYLPSGHQTSSNETAWLAHLAANFANVCNKSLMLKDVVPVYRPKQNIDSSYYYVFECEEPALTISDVLLYDGSEYLPVVFEKTINTKGFEDSFTAKFFKIL